MAEISVVAALLLSAFSSLSETLLRYHTVLEQIQSVREDRDEYDRCYDCILNLATRYDATVRPLLLEAAPIGNDSDDVKRHPERAAEIGRKYLEGLSKHSQKKFAERIAEMEKALSALHKQLRLAVLPSSRLPTPNHIAFREWTDESAQTMSPLSILWKVPISGHERVARFRDGKDQRDRMFSAVDCQISSLDEILAPGRNKIPRRTGNILLGLPVAQEESSDSPYFDLVSDLFPRLRKADRTWLRLRVSTANGVRKRFLQYCCESSGSVRPIRQSTRSHSEGAVQQLGIGTARPRSGTDAYSITSRSETRLYQISEHESLDTRSHVATPQWTKDPLLDDVYESAKMFQCPYCQSQQHCKNHAAWKAHVLSDLRAYVCTWQHCELRMFKTMEEWVGHELTEHNWTRTQQQDGVYAETSRMSGGETTVRHHWKAGQVHIKCLTLSSCLFCDWIPSGGPDESQTPGHQISIDEYRHHVGTHLEEIALAVITVGAEGLVPMPFKESIDLPHLLFQQQNLSLVQRYRIGLAIASSYALSVPSRWRISSWQSRDIFFFVVDGMPQCEAPRLRTDLQLSGGANDLLQRSRAGVMENSLVSLGILLLELYFGTTFENRIARQLLYQPGIDMESHTQDPVELLAIAIRWADEAEDRVGYPYANAVRHCLTKRIDRSSKQEWRHELHSVVVKPIRYNYEMLADLDMRHTGGSCPPSSPRQCQESWRSVKGSTVDVQWT